MIPPGCCRCTYSTKDPLGPLLDYGNNSLQTPEIRLQNWNRSLSTTQYNDMLTRQHVVRVNIIFNETMRISYCKNDKNYKRFLHYFYNI